MCIRGSLCVFFFVYCFLVPSARLQAEGQQTAARSLQELKLRNHVRAFLLLKLGVIKGEERTSSFVPLYHFLLASKQLSESNIYLSPSVKSFYPLKRHAFNSQIFILSQLTKMILGFCLVFFFY